jgi:ATP-binding cassette subfamily B protein
MIAARIRLLRLLRGRGGAGLVSLQLARAVLPVLLALSVGDLVNALLKAHTAGQALAGAGLVAGLFLADQLVWLVIAPVRTLVVRRIDGGVRGRVRRRATGLRGLDELESADFQDRAARAVDVGMGMGRERSPGNAAAGQLELLARIAGATAAAVLVATFSVPLAVVLLGGALAMRAMVRRQWMAIVDKLDADTAGQRYEYYVSSTAVMGAAKDVRLFGLSDWFAGRFRAAVMRTYGPVWRSNLSTLRWQWWIAGLSALAGAAVLALPAAAVLRGDLDPGRLITIVLAGFGVLAMTGLGLEAFDIEYGRRGLTAVDELEERYPATTESNVPASQNPPTVRFEGVSFSYPGAEGSVLDNLSVTLHPGETVAIVGENGAGKTTFVKLLAGLYQPTAGRITIDGVDPRAGRPPIAALFQDFVRYPATLRDNITASAPTGPDDDAVREARSRADAPDLPLDTSLWREGGDGTDLSGGQWQRVALARVLYAVRKGRRLLVLDEPTAHLDVRSEAEFHERVVSQVDGATTILISHRLSTVRPADRILLLANGRITEDGTHDELIALGGDYARFFTTQAAAYARGARP